MICTAQQILFGLSNNTKEVSKACSTYGKRKGAHTVFMVRPEGKRQFGRPQRKWEDNIKVDLQEVGCGAWTELIWIRIESGGKLL